MTTTTFKSAAVGESGNGNFIAMQMFTGSSDLLTAHRNQSDELELLAFTTTDNVIKQVSGAKAGEVSEVTLALLGRRAVTAVCSGAGALLLISWDVPFGLKTVTRLHDSGKAAGRATQIALTQVSPTMLVTALRDGSGNLLLISWSLNADGSFTRLGDSHPAGKPDQAGAVSIVKMVPIAGNPVDSVVTAVRNGSGNLELIHWSISVDGRTITRQGAGGGAGEVSEIELTGGLDGVTTAVRDGSGNLLVIPWQLVAPGGFARGHDVQAGSAQHLSIAHAGPPPATLVATMRNGSGNFEMIALGAASPFGLVRTGSFSSPQNPDVDETKIISMGSGLALTAIREHNALNLRSWTMAST